jgi:hypothetical protein
MTHDDRDRQLQLLHAQIDRLTTRLLQYKQDMARNERIAELMQHLSPDLAQRIGEHGLDQLLEAEGNRAVEEATREFPQFLCQIENRAQRREQRSSASPRRSYRDVDHVSGQTEPTIGDHD